MRLNKYVCIALMGTFSLHGAAESPCVVAAGLPAYINDEAVMVFGTPRYYAPVMLSATFWQETGPLLGRRNRIEIPLKIAAIVEGTNLDFLSEVIRTLPDSLQAVQAAQAAKGKQLDSACKFNKEVLDSALRCAVNGDIDKAKLAKDVCMEAVWFTVLNRGTPAAMVVEYHGRYYAHNKTAMRKVILPLTAQKQLKDVKHAFPKKMEKAEKIKLYSQHVEQKKDEPKHEAMIVKFDAVAYLASLSTEGLN